METLSVKGVVKRNGVVDRAVDGVVDGVVDPAMFGGFYRGLGLAEGHRGLCRAQPVTTMEEWFGYDENYNNSRLGISFINPDEASPDDAVRRRLCADERIYRLLVLDNFSGHHNLELYEYCL